VAPRRRSFSTTNPIENLLGSVRTATRNVKRWRDEAMVRRWVWLGVAAAERSFRRIKGHKDLPVLVRALRSYTVDGKEEAA
jgi:transposase-like protein